MASLARHATGGLAAPSLNIPRPGLRGLGIGAAVAFVVLLVDALINERTRFDVWGIKLIQRLDFPAIRTIWHYVGELTSSEGAVAAWSLAILLFVGLRWWIAAAAFFALPIGGIANMMVGDLVERTRPHLDELTRSSKNFEESSFPSGHVEGAVLFYGLLFVVARRIANPVLRLGVQGGSLAVLATVGVSRVWTGAHWPTDVLAAYALGGMLLAPLAWLYLKLDASLGRLPLIKAAAHPHNEAMPHAHALTSLVLFEGERVVKVYNPGLLPRVIYWLAFQAPFPYVGNRAALRAAAARRNLAALLTRAWYGSERVARSDGIVVRDGRLALSGVFVAGQEPTDRAAARAFLHDLRLRFEEAGLPTWQIDPRQPRAIDNILETADGKYVVVDLESGLVSPMASLTTWKRAIRRGLVPFYDEVFFDVTRDYVAREEPALRAVLGEVGFAELTATLDEAEREAAAWHKSEPRILSKLLRWTWIAVDVRGWPRRTKALFAGGQEKGTAWMEKAVATWESEGRITAAEGAALREQIAAPTFQAMLPYLGAHIAVSIPLRFPFGSVARTLMVIGALGYETSRLLRRRIDRHQWKQAYSIHSPLVAVLAAVPGFGSFAYLAAKPVRANRLLLRTVFDAALLKAPWDLYERTKLRALIVRPLGAAIGSAYESTDETVHAAPAPIVLTATPATEAPVADWGALSATEPAASRPTKRAETRPASRPKPIFDQARPLVTPAWVPLSAMAATSAVRPEELPAPRAA